MDEAVIAESRGKAALLALGAVAFAALGVWLIRNAARTSCPVEAILAGIASIGFFGWCGVIGIATIIRPNRLVLSREGFVLDRPFRQPRRVAWDDIESLFVWSYRRTRLVGYRFREGRAPTDALTRLNQSLGLDGGLPNGWPLGPDELLALLNSWKARSRPEA
jgi:hypothetical protein